jgi:hypothetical protein
MYATGLCINLYTHECSMTTNVAGLKNKNIMDLFKRDVNGVSYHKIGGQTKLHTNRKQCDSTRDRRLVIKYSSQKTVSSHYTIYIACDSCRCGRQYNVLHCPSLHILLCVG